MIKAVTFDLDGVYFTPESFINFKNNLPKLVSDPVLIDDVFYKSEIVKSFRRGEISEEDFWTYVKKTLGVTLPNDEIFKLLRDSYQINNEVKELVAKVRSLGIKACICTNNYPTRIRELDKKFSFLSEFDVKVFSYEVGSIKPEPKIFQGLIEKSGCQPNEIAYADDKEANVEAAKALGINAFVFTTFKAFIDQLRLLGLAI